MSGESELGMLLRSMQPVVRPGEFVFVSIEGPPDIYTHAMVDEEEGRTLVITRECADSRGWPYDYIAGWITLRVQSSLAAVGLTAAVSKALADVGISCNVLAGFHHDHLLVPVDRVGEAVGVLEKLTSK
jgi:uncharacterized protein